MSYLTQAHQMSPESPDVALGVARTSLASGDIEAAEGILDVVVQREDAPPDAWMIRAELELQRERPDEAARVLEEAILRRPMHKPMFQAQIAEISRTDVV
jgi:thioredoxin-like negative regulator of GroEL